MTKIAKNYEVARATNLQFLTEFYAKIYEMHYTEVYFSPQNEFGVSPDSSNNTKLVKKYNGEVRHM